jgi:hypothetical protein
LLALGTDPNEPIVVTKRTGELARSPWKAYVDRASASDSKALNRGWWGRSFELFKVLLEHGADPDINVKQRGETAIPLLDYLALKFDSAQCEELRDIIQARKSEKAIGVPEPEWTPDGEIPPPRYITRGEGETTPRAVCTTDGQGGSDMEPANPRTGGVLARILGWVEFAVEILLI